MFVCIGALLYWLDYQKMAERVVVIVSTVIVIMIKTDTLPSIREREFTAGNHVIRNVYDMCKL